MGTQGVPLNIPKSAIIDSIKKNNGVLTYVCRELDIHHSTALKIINADPELVELLKEERHSFTENLCDLSENVLKEALIQREDLNSAIRSSQYVLNNQGRKRGYTPLTVPVTDEQIKKAEAQFDRIDRQLSELKKPEAKSSEIDSHID
jgi:hypothetical protein